MNPRDDPTPDWLHRDRYLFGGLLGFCCVCILQILGVQSLTVWLQVQLFCHAVAIPLLASRFVRLMRSPAKIQPRTKVERGVETLAASLAVVGFGCVLAHLNVYAGVTFLIAVVVSGFLTIR